MITTVIIYNNWPWFYKTVELIVIILHQLLRPIVRLILFTDNPECVRQYYHITFVFRVFSFDILHPRNNRYRNSRSWRRRRRRQNGQIRRRWQIDRIWRLQQTSLGNAYIHQFFFCMYNYSTFRSRDLILNFCYLLHCCCYTIGRR